MDRRARQFMTSVVIGSLPRSALSVAALLLPSSVYAESLGELRHVSSVVSTMSSRGRETLLSANANQTVTVL